METNEKSRVLDMTKGKPFRLVLKFALPLFFGNLLQQFYNLAGLPLFCLNNNIRSTLCFSL